MNRNKFITVILCFVVPFNFIFDLIGIVFYNYKILGESLFQIWSGDCGFLIGYAISVLAMQKIFLFEKDGKIIDRLVPSRTVSPRLAMWHYVYGIIGGALGAEFMNYCYASIFKDFPPVFGVILVTFTASLSVPVAFYEEGYSAKLILGSTVASEERRTERN